MPIYVYRCRHCSHSFEELVLSRDKVGTVKCPQCQSSELQQLQAAFATPSGGRPDSSPVCGQGACSSCTFDD